MFVHDAQSRKRAACGLSSATTSSPTSPTSPLYHSCFRDQYVPRRSVIRMARLNLPQGAHIFAARTCRRPPTPRTSSHYLARTASTSSNPYPFPLVKQPSPHQIFHLPKGASRADVKARCTSRCPVQTHTPLTQPGLQRLRARAHIPPRLPREPSCTAGDRTRTLPGH